MSIQKNILIIMFIMSVSMFLVHSGRAIETETCKTCHGYVKPLDSITNDCSACHTKEDHQDLPSMRDREFVHVAHSQYVYLTQQRCTICHQQRPDCTKCHNSHEIVRGVNSQNTKLNVAQNKLNTSNTLNTSDCINCHGKLPTPLGHDNFRRALSKSMHQWMNCRTCHVNAYIEGKGNNFGLHFKDLLVVPIDDSVELCKICHSFQYNKLKNGEHGNPGQKCVDCHNPHTTDFTGSKLITRKETPTNISSQIESAENWITTKVPILKNTTILLIIVIIIAMTVAEHILSREEEGKKTAYHTIKVHDSEDTLKTLEVKLKNKDINIISEILETSGINILGMTMTKEERKDINIYKYVIFVNIEKPTDESILIDKIITMDNVKSAIFTDKYEL